MIRHLQGLLEAADYYFQRGDAVVALHALDQASKDIDRLPPALRLGMLEAIAHILGKHNRSMEAVRCHEELVRLDRMLEPNSVATARDLVRLADMYRKQDRVDAWRDALLESLAVYARLEQSERTRLEPEEVQRAERELHRANRLIAERLTGPGPDEDRRSTLLAIVGTIERELEHLTRYPETLLQALINDHCAGGNASSALTKIGDASKAYLANERHTWLALVETGGPGRDAWRQRRMVRTTAFPDQLAAFGLLADGRLLGIGTKGGVWIAPIAGKPQEVHQPLHLAEGHNRLAVAGATVAVVERAGQLSFLEVSEGSLVSVGASFADTSRVIAHGAGFLVALTDGGLLLCDARGEATTRFAQIGLPNPGVLTATASSLAFEAKKLDTSKRPTAELCIIDLDSKQQLARRQVELLVHTATFTPSGTECLIGCMEGLYHWQAPWDSDPKRLEGGTVRELVFSPDYRYMATVDLGTVVQDLVRSVVVSLPTPGSQLLTEHVAFAPEGETALVHAASGQLIATWELSSRLHWVERGTTSELLADAFFAEQGRLLIGDGAFGDRFAWDVASGQLLEFDKGGRTAMQPVVWAPGGLQAAVCHEDMVELINERGESVSSVGAPLPFGATWDDEGHRLAFACQSQRVIVVLDTETSPPTAWGHSCSEGFCPSAVALSPGGKLLAYGQSILGSGRHRLGGAGTMTSSPIRLPGREPEAVVVERATGESRVLVSDLPEAVTRLGFLSGSRLAVFTADGMLTILDVRDGRVLVRWWAQAPIVGFWAKDAGTLLVAESGEATSQRPLVYELALVNP